MIMHLDMDAFFAAIEQLDNPQYIGKPVIVGGGERGVVSTASYEARKFGIHSAMPMAVARKLCPRGIFVKGRYQRYSQLSRLIMNCLRDFSDCVQSASIDEAYLALPHDCDGLLQARNVKEAIKKVSGGLTCSVGVAPVKFLAKICSDINKPDGIFVLSPKQADDFLVRLNVRKIPGVGTSMGASLSSFGIDTVAQLRTLSRDFMAERYGKFGIILHERAWGIDRRQVHENPPPKSEGRERTFAINVRDRTVLMKCLLEQAEKVSSRLQGQGLKGRTITVKIKFADFKQITRARSLPFRINSTREIAQVAQKILSETVLPQPVRLLGVCVSSFDPRPEQLFLPGLARLDDMSCIC